MRYIIAIVLVLLATSLFADDKLVLTAKQLETIQIQQKEAIKKFFEDMREKNEEENIRIDNLLNTTLSDTE